MYTLDPYYHKMIAPAEKKPTIKIAGYLEKRGKMRVVCRWKRWWFVLEGRLLLYYKSQLEYINLSPCRGSLNLGLASSVLPGKGLELQVVTRSQTVTLRAGNRIDHEQWLQSLVDAMALQGSVNPFCLRPVLHFRYCNDVPLDQRGSVVDRIKRLGGRSYTLATPTNNSTSSDLKGVEETASLISEPKSSNIVQCNLKKCLLRRHMSFSNDRLKDNKQFDRQSIRNSIRHSKIAFSDTSIPISVHNQISPSESNEKCQSMKELHDSFCTTNIDNHEYVEIDIGPKNIPFILVEKPPSKEKVSTGRESNSVKVNLNVDILTNGCSKDDLKNDKIENLNIFVGGCENSESDNPSVYQDNRKSNLGIVEYKEKNKLCVQLYQNKEVKSDTDLSMKKKSKTHSGSCGEIHSLNNNVNSKLVEPAVNSQLLSHDKNLSDFNCDETQNSSCRRTNKTRSNSMIRKCSKDGKTETEAAPLQRRGTLRKRSLSFLRRVWKKREKKTEEQDYETVDYESIPPFIEVQKPTSDQIVQKQEEFPKEESLPPAPEPPPDYDISISDESEIPPMLPPRLKKRPHSPWHDIPTNNMPVLPPDDEPPPALPEKMRNKINNRIAEDGSVHCVKHQELSYNRETVCYQSETTVRVNNVNKIDIDTLLAELSEINISPIRKEFPTTREETSQTIRLISSEKESEPDYDIPRPHSSLLTTLRIHTTRTDTIPATNFLCSTPIPEKDSLDSMLSRFSSEVDITPDSLECEIPWSLSGQAEVTDITWPRPALLNEANSLQRHFITTEEKAFEDSLNT